MKMGLSVTWDNPDIEIFRGGVPVAPFALLPATDYDVRIRVWNGSYDAPALNLPVALSYLSFGIGVSSTAIATGKADLDVKGGPLEPAFTSIPWKTPPLAGHYCLQALLIWPDDANPDNNLGQKNVQVGTAHSPAVFDIQVHNDAGIARAFTFEVDQYVIPPLAPCSDQASPTRPRCSSTYCRPAGGKQSAVEGGARRTGLRAFPARPRLDSNILSGATSPGCLSTDHRADYGAATGGLPRPANS